jgi:predicted  nucleic acid-binding Zn-ribbon protein
VSALDAPAGNPAALQTSIDQLAATEAALSDAAARIEATLADGDGKSIEELRSRSGRATAGMQAAHERYSAATAALREYEVELNRFHNEAYAAIAAYDEAASRLATAQWSLAEAERQVVEAALQPDLPQLLEEARQLRRNARRAVDAATEAMAVAHQTYVNACEAIAEAARIAAERIKAGFDATVDSLLDRLQDLWDGFTNLLASIVEWAISFFQQVLEVIAAAVELFLTALLVVLLVIALIAVLVIALVLLVVLLVVVVALITMIVAQLLEMFLAGYVGYRIADLLGLEGADRLRLIVGMVSAVCPAFGIFVVSRLLDEAMKPAPEVKELDESGLEPTEAAALDQLDNMVPQDVADLLEMAGLVDTVGGADQAVVNVTRIVDEQGNVSWIVTLPSTMDWVVGGDKGAPNDLDADLMLMLFPELRTQYEKAVLDAMAQAGIGQNEPVVLAGWSLGGIMAGSLIEDGAGGYAYSGLVCAGSPIDEMAVPKDVPVIQVKHTLDPVHRLDMVDSIPPRDGMVELWDGPRSGGASDTIRTGNAVGHHNGDYVATLESHLAYNSANGVNLNDPFASNAFPVDDPNTPERVTVSHQQFAFHE